MKIKFISPHARIPTRATPGASGYDLSSCAAVRIPPHSRRKVPLGIALEIPHNVELQVRPRSGNSLRGIDVALGTVDSDYRGEISATVINTTDRPYYISAGHKVAQGVFAIAGEVSAFVQVTHLSETVRGSGGFGSTGT